MVLLFFLLLLFLLLLLLFFLLLLLFFLLLLPCFLSSVLFVLVVFLSMYCTICVFKGKKGLLASSHGQVMSSPGLRRSFDPAWPPTVMDDDW